MKRKDKIKKTVKRRKFFMIKFYFTSSSVYFLFFYFYFIFYFYYFYFTSPFVYNFLVRNDDNSDECYWLTSKKETSIGKTCF